MNQESKFWIIKHRTKIDWGIALFFFLVTLIFNLSILSVTNFLGVLAIMGLFTAVFLKQEDWDAYAKTNKNVEVKG